MSIASLYVDAEQLIKCRHYAKRLKLFASAPAKSQMLGETRSRFRGRGLEFEEVRAYHAGDDIRSIDWRITAKTLKAHTRLNTEDRERPILLVIDQRNTMFFASQKQLKSVLAAKIASYIAWAGLSDSDRITAVILGDNAVIKVGGKRMRKSVLQMIQQLCSFNTQLPHTTNNSLAFIDALKLVQKVTRPGTSIYLISDFYDIDQNCNKLLSHFARNNELYFIQTLDPIEQKLDIIGSKQLSISDGLQSRSLYFHQKLLQDYRTWREQLDQNLTHYARRSMGKNLIVSTGDDPWQFLYQHFH